VTFPDLPRAVFGVDFSGARDAGRKIWLAAGHIDGQRLRIESCLRASELHGGASAREQAHAALLRFILSSGVSISGLDFPLSISQRAIQPRYATWEDFVRAFPTDYPSPESFQSAMKDIGRKAVEESPELAALTTGGHEKILKRRADIDAQTPFAPHNERLYRQTYYGICNLLSPLARYGRTRVLPMQEPVAGAPWLIEICPASTLKLGALGPLYQTYKDSAVSARDHRTRVLAALERQGVWFEQARIREKVLADDHGDALDSVLGAFATWRALQEPRSLLPRDDQERLEGRVYL
jgi:hypothetical protein